MSHTRRRVLSTAMLGAASAVTGACSAEHPKPAGTRPLEKVTYLTGLGAFGREAFAWVAAAKGYFRDAGLAVTIVPGAAGDENLKKIAGGAAQFGVIDYAGAVIRAGKGAFDPFRLVAALNNQTLIAIMSLVGRGITIPADLRGKTIAQAEGAVVRTLFPGYARLAGLDPRTVQWTEVAATGLPALLRLLDNYVGRSTSGAPIGVFEPAKVSRGTALMQSLGQFTTAYPVDKVVWFGATDRKDR
jgi:NitT/TauT family transport system substrate-binding protein